MPLLPTMIDAIGLAAPVLASAIIWARVFRRREDRLGWSLMAMFLSATAASDIVQYALYGAGDASVSDWFDLWYLAGYTLAFAGAAALLRERERTLRPIVGLDGLTIGLSLGTLGALLLVDPVLRSTTSGSVVPTLIAAAFPILDVLLLGLVGVALAWSNWLPRGCWAPLAAGMALFATYDLAAVWMSANAASGATASVTDLIWAVGAALVAHAAWRDKPPLIVGDDAPSAAVPILSAIVVGAIVVWSQIDQVGSIAAVTSLAAVAATAVRARIVSRQTQALLRETRGQALADGLTGLGNRRLLVRDLDAALASGASAAARTLAFFDLDGFKTYNDTFGHGAGDDLLREIARRVDDGAVAARAKAYRLGGDEFCVLFESVVASGDGVLADVLAAMAEQRDEACVTASHGLVALPDEATTTSEALEIADARMYHNKGGRRSTRPSRSAIAAALAQLERDSGVALDPAIVAALTDIASAPLADAAEFRKTPPAAMNGTDAQGSVRT